MKNRELKRQLQRIEDLINSTSDSTDDNLELQGHWGRYLCVLAAGFLENAISEIYIEFVNKSSSPHVASFTRRKLQKIQNPKAGKFVETAYAFSNEWGKELENLFENDSSLKDAIDSIMSNRHNIAHGKQTSISVIRVKEYLLKSIQVIEFIELQCNS